MEPNLRRSTPGDDHMPDLGPWDRDRRAAPQTSRATSSATTRPLLKGACQSASSDQSPRDIGTIAERSTCLSGGRRQEERFAHIHIVRSPENPAICHAI